MALQVTSARNRSKLSAALHTKDPELIKECAVLVIQSSWKARRAIKAIKKLKQEKYNLILEMAARKIQRLFRQRKLLKQQHRKVRPSLHRDGSSHHSHNHIVVELEHEK